MLRYEHPLRLSCSILAFRSSKSAVSIRYPEEFGFSGKMPFVIPKTESVIPQPAAAPENVPADSKPAVYVAQQTNEFIEYLLKTYRPRLSTTAYSPDLGVMGAIEFYGNFEVVETYTVKELHSLNVSLLRRPTVWILSMPVKHLLCCLGRFLTTSNRQTNSPTIRQN